VETLTGHSSFQPSQSSSSSFVVATARTQSILTAEAVENKRDEIIEVILESPVLVVSPGVVTFFRTSHRVARVAMVDGGAFLTLKLIQALNKSFSVGYGGDATFNASMRAGRRR
jgi:hypothetical protein